MSDPLTVVHVVLSLAVGGLERIVVSLVRESRSLGQRVAVVCLENHGTLAPRVEALGARVSCVHKRPGVRPEVVSRVRNIFRELRPDVVHTHQVGPLLYAGLAARLAGVPVVVHTEHGKHYTARRRTRWLGRVAGHCASRFFCVSRDIAAEVLACGVAPRRKVCVVPNGVDTAKFRPSADRDALRRSLGIPIGAPVIGTVGRLNEVKRQDVLIRGFARLRAHHPLAHLLLVGDGPLRDELSRLAHSLGLGGSVHFVGYQDQPERYLQAMDVFALTSRVEGMPLAILEAWAARVPAVASRVGGLPELIEDGRTGLLFPPGDEAALTAALDRLLTEENLARQLRETARDRVEARYDTRHMASHYQGHYLELLARDESRAQVSS